MSIKMDVHAIANAGGEGAERQFVKLIPGQVRTRAQLKEAISHSCTLTGSDVEAVLSALYDVVLDGLSRQGRFYLPEIGYFTLSAGVSLPQGLPMSKVRGNYVAVRYIRFKPERKLLEAVRRKARFERMQGTTVSRRYTEAEMARELEACLSAHGSVTRRVVQSQFGLTRYSAQKWLNHFVDSGLVKREGLKTAPIYKKNSPVSQGE